MAVIIDKSTETRPEADVRTTHFVLSWPRMPHQLPLVEAQSHIGDASTAQCLWECTHRQASTWSPLQRRFAWTLSSDSVIWLPLSTFSICLWRFKRSQHQWRHKGNHWCDVFLRKVLSQLVDEDLLLSQFHKNINCERFGKLRKYEEDVSFLLWSWSRWFDTSWFGYT